MTNKSITTEGVQSSKSKQNADPIVGAAKDLEVDLIVLSTHNYQWFSHLIHGSDAEGVLRHAPCPMLVVRKEEHDFIDAN